MNRYKNLYDMANSIYAVGKIGEVLNDPGKNEHRGGGTTAGLETAGRILDILAQYAPGPQRAAIGEVAGRGRLYLDICQKLNQQFNTYRNKRADRNDFVRTLAIIQPVMGPGEKIIIDKIIKLNEVFS